MNESEVRRMKLQEEKLKKVKEKERVDKSMVRMDRNNQEAQMNEALMNFRIIRSSDTNVRKEEINKELLFIRKIWDSMSQDKVKEKRKLEYEMYENDRRFEMFNDNEKDLILAIALGDFKLKLEKGDIRNAVKLEI
jgi:hypothetical protein